jgi:hypothetical protein
VGLTLREASIHALRLNKNDAQFKDILAQFKRMKDNAKVKVAYARVCPSRPRLIWSMRGRWRTMGAKSRFNYRPKAGVVV